MQVICGVDIARDWLDAHIDPGGIARRFANDAAGIGELAALCRAHGVGLAVMEASGGYEQAVHLGLWQAGTPGAVASARAVRDYARAMGVLEKTDRIDAAMIAGYARARRLQPAEPRSEDARRMAALCARMRQIASDITVQKQRLASTRDPLGRASLGEVIALLARQQKAIAAAIAALIEADPLWRALDRTFRSVKGVAGRTVATLIGELPEIGTISNKAIAKLAGLAPIANDSGARNGPRSIRGGRPSVRSILYLVADVARRFDPSLADMRQRLLDQGKPKMVVRIALARKLLVRLNAKARDTRQNLPTGA